MAGPVSQQNRILRHLSDDALALLEPHFRPLDLSLRQVLMEPGERIRNIYFPETCVISLVSPLIDGRQPELATIGREGIAGCIAAIGSREAFGRWLVEVDGRALSLPAETFQRCFEESASLRQAVICYTEALLCQTMQSVACNAIHPVEARCCRWILMHQDRTDGDEVPLTQEFLAELLSVHRSSVSIVTRSLQSAGMIEVHRGSLRVRDREGLETTSCECYEIVRERYERLLPGTFG